MPPSTPPSPKEAATPDERSGAAPIEGLADAIAHIETKCAYWQSRDQYDDTIVDLGIIAAAARAYQEAAAELVDVRAQLADARFAPMGDNHHNAAVCPYCRPTLAAQDAELARVNGEREYRSNALLAAWRRSEDEICQALGKALGYTWFKDDPKNFPNATEADGVCVGDHVAASIAMEAASALTAERERSARLEGALRELVSVWDRRSMVASYLDWHQALAAARAALTPSTPKEPT